MSDPLATSEPAPEADEPPAAPIAQLEYETPTPRKSVGETLRETVGVALFLFGGLGIVLMIVALAMIPMTAASGNGPTAAGVIAFALFGVTISTALFALGWVTLRKDP